MGDILLTLLCSWYLDTVLLTWIVCAFICKVQWKYFIYKNNFNKEFPVAIISMLMWEYETPIESASTQITMLANMKLWIECDLFSIKTVKEWFIYAFYLVSV